MFVCLQLDASTGTLLWSFKTGDEVEASAAVGKDGTVYIASDDSFVRCVQRFFVCVCKLQNNSSSLPPFIWRPAWLSLLVCLCTPRPSRSVCQVYALNPITGTKIWQTPLGACPPSLPPTLPPSLPPSL